MKIKGQKIEGANEEIIVIPRGEDSIILKARAILDFKEFETLCPEPEMAQKTMISGRKVDNPNDKSYKDAVEDHNKQYMAYMVIKSLEATVDLEWETVDLQNPDTWQNYEQELRDSGFTEIELGRIVTGVFTANSLNEAKIAEAKERFLAEAAQAESQ